jgi:hypothetical protein
MKTEKKKKKKKNKLAWAIVMPALHRILITRHLIKIIMQIRNKQVVYGTGFSTFQIKWISFMVRI